MKRGISSDVLPWSSDLELAPNMCRTLVKCKLLPLWEFKLCVPRQNLDLSYDFNHNALLFRSSFPLLKFLILSSQLLLLSFTWLPWYEMKFETDLSLCMILCFLHSPSESQVSIQKLAEPELDFSVCLTIFSILDIGAIEIDGFCYCRWTFMYMKRTASLNHHIIRSWLPIENGSWHHNEVTSSDLSIRCEVPLYSSKRIFIFRFVINLQITSMLSLPRSIRAVTCSSLFQQVYLQIVIIV